MIDIRPTAQCVFTAGLVLLVAVSSVMGKSAVSKKSAKGSPIIIGKNLIASKRCNTCHGASLNGMPQFSPSLRASGVLKEYNKTTFETVLNTGKTNDGGMVMSPMPVYHLPASSSDAIYAYLKSLN